MVVENFGRNLRFEPSNILSPKTSEQIIDYLNEQRPRQVRVIASGHAWSPLIETNSTLIDLVLITHIRASENGTVTTSHFGQLASRMVCGLKKRW